MLLERPLSMDEVRSLGLDSLKLAQALGLREIHPSPVHCSALNYKVRTPRAANFINRKKCFALALGSSEAKMGALFGFL